MTTPAPAPQHWSTKGLRRLATAFVTQEHEGVLGGLLLRLARFLQGDPVIAVSVTCSTGAQAQLPDDVRAQCVVLTVSGNPVRYRTDGGIVLNTDPQLPVGAFITLTGRPTIEAFRFVNFAGVNATLTGSYFD